MATEQATGAITQRGVWEVECARGTEKSLFAPTQALSGAFIITQRVKPHGVMVEQACAQPRRPDVGQEVSKDLLQLVEVSGLSKIEAEDLLDLFEAAGYDLCQLSFVDGEGFSVRPTSLQPQKAPPQERT